MYCSTHNHRHTKALVLVCLCFFVQQLSAQQEEDYVEKFYNNRQLNVWIADVVDGDTIYYVNLPEVDVMFMQEMMRKHPRKYDRLTRNVKKVYPYAYGAREILYECELKMKQTDDENERKEMMKQAEDELYEKYSAELMKLTFSQGNILLRLIDRETQQTSYNLVQELRGKFRAFFWQGFARMWGYNLKVEYDPINNDEDKAIETIVQLIECGML